MRFYSQYGLKTARYIGATPITGHYNVFEISTVRREDFHFIKDKSGM